MTTNNESETPETDEMTRLYREQVAPVLDTLAAGACTRILNKMGQIERERNEALRKTLIAVNRAHDAQAQLIPTLLRAEAAEAELAHLRQGSRSWPWTWAGF